MIVALDLVHVYRSITQKPLKWFQEKKALFDHHDETSGQSKVINICGKQQEQEPQHFVVEPEP
jgi:hypothetical protein